MSPMVIGNGIRQPMSFTAHSVLLKDCSCRIALLMLALMGSGVTAEEKTPLTLLFTQSSALKSDILQLGQIISLSPSPTHSLTTAQLSIPHLPDHAPTSTRAATAIEAAIRLRGAMQAKKISPGEAWERHRLGEFYFFFGMADDAHRLLQAEAHLGGLSEADANEAWLALARLYLRHGRLDEAQQALAQVHAPIDVQADEYAVTRAALWQARGDERQVIETLSPVQGRSTWAAMAAFNLGAALLARGDEVLGVRQMRRVTQWRDTNENVMVLRDRAYSALGYFFLRKGDFAQAREEFVHSRATGAAASPALLGLGWVHLRLERYALALASWLALRDRPMRDTDVVEAYLAVPFAFAQARAWGQARDAYHIAIVAYEAELMRVVAAQQRWTGADFADELVAGLTQPQSSWATDPVLRRALTEDTVFNLVREAASLRALRQSLGRWRETVTSPQWHAQAQVLNARLDAMLSTVDTHLRQSLAVIGDDWSLRLNTYLDQARFALARMDSNSSPRVSP